MTMGDGANPDRIQTDKETLDHIQHLLSGKEWDGDAIERVAEIVRLSGRAIHEVRDWEVTVSISFIVEGHDEDVAIAEGVAMAKDVQHNDYNVQVSRFTPAGQNQPEKEDE